MNCYDGDCSGASCTGDPWVAYQPIGEIPCSEGNFTILNPSTDLDDNIIETRWIIWKNGAIFEELSPCSGLCDYTPQASLPPGDYVVELIVKDEGEEVDSTSHNFRMKKEVRAGFMCSFDNSNWLACENIIPSLGEIIYFKDDPSDQSPLPEHSSVSEGASAIVSRQWYVLGESGYSFGLNDANPATTLNVSSATIRLEVEDNLNRVNAREHTISLSLPIPQLREAAPR